MAASDPERSGDRSTYFTSTSISNFVPFTTSSCTSYPAKSFVSS